MPAFSLSPSTWFAIGLQHAAAEELDLAKTALRNVLAVEPDNAQALFALGMTEGMTNALSAARDAFDRIGSRIADAPLHAACARLLSGDFRTGWPAYESRLALLPRHKSAAPRWVGGDPAGSTILLHAEQGHGDTIMFARYAPILAGRGAKIILEVQPALKTLLSPLADIVIAQGDPIPAHDAQIPLMSLPLAFATSLETIPPPAPLGIHAGQTSGIGLAWAGNPDHATDAERSIPLQALRPLFETSPVTLLQPDRRPGDGAILAGLPNVHIPPLQDFAETASLIAGLDLVVTADTAVAHLAGTIGRPTWLLLPFAPDFRWLLNRDDTPWYPSVRLFRQASRGDWRTVIETVVTEVKQGRGSAPHPARGRAPGPHNEK